MDGWRELLNSFREALPYLIMIVAALAVEHAPKLSTWWNSPKPNLSPGWKFATMVVLSVAMAIGLGINQYIYSDVGLTWTGLADVVFTAFFAWLSGQGYKYVEKFFKLRSATKKRLAALEAR